MSSLFAIGHLTLDDVVFHDGRVQMGNLGGASLYAALGAQLVGADAGIVSRLGSGYPVDELRAMAVDTRLVEVADRRSVHQWVLYEADGSRQYVLHPSSGALRDLTPRARNLALPPRSAVHLAPMHIEFQATWCHRLNKRTSVLTLDPHVESCQARPTEVLASLPKVTAFLPSHLEATAIGEADPVRSVRLFLDAGAPIAVVKLGAAGAIVGSSDGLWHVPPVGVTERDATGAGDTYCGAFAAALQQGCSSLDAARWGGAAASLAVEWHGTEFATLPNRREIVQERMHAISPQAISVDPVEVELKG